ncbi:ribosome biogenesis GTPase YqeH [Shouchella shacheensis]|uniref:ribosome biogenesis GTPase YqeH n=1 Tax=Shouchella shacheensis TaxID=1649580 RepID=UPI0007402F4C|nr:ribosome biogenesis GTPase YqeH [Shouchella shacheensis]
MSEETIHCSGCGIAIQTEEPEKLGFAPKSALSRDVIVCKRCYRLKHYNEVQDVEMSDDDFLKLFQSLHHKEALIVKVVDIFDFNGSWISGVHRFVGNNQVMLVANKVDLLPKSTNRNKLINWIKKSASEWGLKPREVKLMSAKSGEGIGEVAEGIDRLRNGRDVYVVGCTNVGKSSFLNRIIKDFFGDADTLITTSHFPGTTLDLIDVPLDDGRALIDTPGLINHHQMAHVTSSKSLRAITPKKEIKPVVFQLKAEQTLFLGGLARLDFLKGNPASFIVHIANEVGIHRTKLEKADDLYESHAGTLLQPPFSEEGEEVLHLKKHTFKIPAQKTDVVFSGLGWITISGDGSTVCAYAPEGVGVSMRPSITS